MPQFRHTITGGVQYANEGSSIYKRFTTSDNWEMIDDRPAPQPAPAKSEPTRTPASEPEPTYPRHVGGGYYELPNGERYRGKSAAIDAMIDQG